MSALLLQVVLIFLNAVFASAEIAVISVSDAKLAKLEEDGNKKAKKLKKLTENPANFLATIQIAITLSGFLASAFAAENFSYGLAELLFCRRVSAVRPENGSKANIPSSTAVLGHPQSALDRLAKAKFQHTTFPPAVAFGPILTRGPAKDKADSFRCPP